MRFHSSSYTTCTESEEQMKLNLKQLALYGLLLVVLFSFTSTIGIAVDYPAKGPGYVNDYARILTENEANTLNNDVIAYEKKTGIEIAVVTVNTTGGMDIDTYAKGLFDTWGVGKAGKDNGVMLMLDPVDRAVTIVAGKGIDNILNDRARGDIIDNDAVPSFRNDDWATGVIKGTHGIMNFFDQQSKQAAAQAGPSGTNQQNSGGWGILTWIAIALVVLIVVGAILARAGSNTYKKENTKFSDDCATLLVNLKNVHPKAKAVLEKLAAENPESVWKDLKAVFAEIRLDIMQPEVELMPDDMAKLSSKIANDKFKDIKQRLSAALDTCAKIVALGEQVGKARAEVQSAFANMPQRIVDAAEAVKHKDVSDQTRGNLTVVSDKFKEVTAAYAGLDPKTVDWLEVHKQTEAIDAAIKGVQSDAKRDIDIAETARTEGPKMLANMKDIEAQIRADSGTLNSYGESQRMLRQAEAQLAEAQRLSTSGNNIDWIPFYLAMQSAQSQRHNAVQKYNTHVEEVKAEAVRMEARRRSGNVSGTNVSGSHDFSGGRSGDSTSRKF